MVIGMQTKILDGHSKSLFEGLIWKEISTLNIKDFDLRFEKLFKSRLLGHGLYYTTPETSLVTSPMSLATVRATSLTARSPEDDTRNGHRNATRNPRWSSQVSFHTAHLIRDLHFLNFIRLIWLETSTSSTSSTFAIKDFVWYPDDGRHTERWPIYSSLPFCERSVDKWSIYSHRDE